MVEGWKVEGGKMDWKKFGDPTWCSETNSTGRWSWKLSFGFWVLGPTVVAQLGGGSGAETANSAKPTPAAATKRHKLILFAIFLLIRFGSHKSSQKSTLSHLLNIYEKNKSIAFQNLFKYSEQFGRRIKTNTKFSFKYSVLVEIYWWWGR